MEHLALVEETEERYWEAEIYRLKGELLLNASREGEGMRDERETEAEACF